MPGDVSLYYSSVEEREGKIFSLSSRALACMAKSGSLESAEKIVEEAVSKIKGSLFHRKDIGTKKLIQKRIDHMKEVLRD